MPPRRIALYVFFFLMMPFALGWFLLHYLDAFPAPLKPMVLPKQKPPIVAPSSRSMPFEKETQALMAAVQENPASPKARRLLEQARRSPAFHLEALARTIRSEDSPADRLWAVRLLGAIPSEGSVLILRDGYPRFLGDAPLRMEAVKSLTILQGFGAFDVLLGAVQIEPDLAVKRQILESLSLLAEEKDVPRMEAVLKQVEGLSLEEVSLAANAPGERRGRHEKSRQASGDQKR